MPGYRVTAGDLTSQDYIGRGSGDLPYSGIIIPSANYGTGGQNIAPITEFGTLGAQALAVVIDITTFTGGTNVVFNVEMYDPASQKWILVLASAALVATGTTTLRISPWSTTSANAAAQFHLTRTMRIKPIYTGTFTNITFSVAGHVQ